MDKQYISALFKKVSSQLVSDKTNNMEFLDFHKATKKINRLLLNVKNEFDLFQQICEILIQLDFIDGVWIGGVQKDSFDVKLMAYAGMEEGAAHTIKVSWDESPYSKGPTGTAIKTKQVFIASDIGANSAYDAWRQEISTKGYSSSAAVPLIYLAEVIGVLNLYSKQKNTFKDEIVDFLKEVGEDIALGLKSIRVEREMLNARDVAIAADYIKSQFVSNLSHEIRTPMNGIIGLTDVTLMTDLSEEQRENLELVKFSAKSLLKIITDVLDYSKIEAGEINVTSIAFNLKKCINEVIELFSIVAKEKGIELCLLYDEMLPNSVFGDSVKIKQVLSNLIGNAFKFTPEGRVIIEIALEEETNEHLLLRFGIIDTGIGIPYERRERLFTSFAQLDNSYTKEYGGVGLGLAASKRITELMGGKIWFESEEGSGSKFYFTVKVRRLDYFNR